MRLVRFLINDQGKEVLKELRKYGDTQGSNDTDLDDLSPRQVEKLLSRSVMRNPNEELTIKLQEVRNNLKNMLFNFNDIQLDWLIGGAPAARGTFKNARALRAFFTSDQVTMSRLICGLCSIATMMSYRSIDKKETEGNPIPDVDSPEHEMYDFVHSLLDDTQKPPFIGANHYTARRFDYLYEVEEGKVLGKDYVPALQEVVSDVSDEEDEDQKRPRRTLQSLFFNVRSVSSSPAESISWPAAAFQDGIAIRAHVSGTVPLALAFYHVLFTRFMDDWFLNDDNVRQFAGAVFLPTYCRGDFHAIAETVAGVEFYLAWRAKTAIVEIPPRECLKMGLTNMAKASSLVVSPLILKVKDNLSFTDKVPVVQMNDATSAQLTM